MKVAKNALLPALDVSLSASFLGDGWLADRDYSAGERAPMPHFGNNFAIEASQVLYTGGAVSGGIAVAKLQQQFARLDKEKNRQSVRFLLVGNYLELYKLGNQVEVYQKNIEQTRRLLTDIKARQEEGLALRNDITRYELQLQTLEFTDNAQVRQLIVPVNSRVQGFVEKICFAEYQVVHKGDTLARIEDTEFRFRLAQAEADYQNALSGKSAMTTTIHTTQNNISVSDAGIEEAHIRMENAGREYNRYKNLHEKEAVTRQQYDAVKTNYEALKVRYELLLRQRQSTALVKQEQTQRLEQTEASIELARAAVELARLNLSYTVIVAPCDGTTGRKNIQEGQLIQPGQTLVDVVDANDKWVVANYKETQTVNIREGQLVEILVDAVPGVVFSGVVRSVSRATGASFSLIPQDNSAGNFVKVEQRIPIRIEFADQNRREDLERLCSGMNVECEVKY